MKFHNLVLIFLVLVLFACSTADTKNEGTATSKTPHPAVYLDATYQIRKTSNVLYGEGLSHTDWGSSETTIHSLYLDVYQPQDAAGKRPAIILIHGGGYRQGNRMHEPIQQAAGFFAARGWVAITIDYRLAGHFGTVPEEWRSYISTEYPAQSYDQGLAIYPASRDAKAAVRWVYANAEAYKIDTKHITVLGGSAGASLAIMLGVTEAENFRDELTLEEDPTLSSTHLNQPSQVHTIIDLWGPAFSVDGLGYVYSIQSYDSDDPPMMIVHGTEDVVVAFERAEYLKAKYEETGAAFTFYELTGESHSAWTAEVEGKTLFELALEFIIEHQKLTYQE